MALVACPECGRMVSPNAEECPHCGAPVKELISQKSLETEPKAESFEKKTTPVEKPLETKDSPKAVEKPKEERPQPTSDNNRTSDAAQPSAAANGATPAPKKSKKGLVITIIVLLLAAIGVGGWFYYNNVYIPEKRDAEAPRYYVMSGIINMRSSPDFDMDNNKIGSLPYGTEIIVYDIVTSAPKPYLYGKYAPKDASGKVIKDKVVEGYLAYDYMATKADFFLLNSIFGNDDARKMLSETRYKKALLSYFKHNHYKGNISKEKMEEYGIDPMATETWQVFCRHEKAKSNNVYRSRKYRKDSKYTDLAVIITNKHSQRRQLLYFIFDDDETFHLLTEQSAPNTGYMKDGTLKLMSIGNGRYEVHVEYE